MTRIPVRFAAGSAAGLLTLLGLAALLETSVPGQPAAATNASAPPPKTAPPKAPKRTGTKWDLMDLGPFFSSGVAGKHPALKGLSIQLATNAAACFDTELLRLTVGWTGGFLRLPTGRDGLEGVPEPVGQPVFFTGPGPGWAKDGRFDDPRGAAEQDPKGRANGPLPHDWAHWRGLFLHGTDVVLSYSVGGASVLELPGFSSPGGLPIFTRSFEIDGASGPLALKVHEGPGTAGTVTDRLAVLDRPNPADPTAPHCLVAALVGSVQGQWKISPGGRLHLDLPALAGASQFQIALWSGPKKELGSFQEAIGNFQARSLKSLTQGGPGRWDARLVTSGVLGTNEGPYTVDTLTLPDQNPWKSWIRCSGFDFFKDPTKAAVCSVSGDVWLVEGINDRLQELRWKRYATGLFQPLGLKIVEDKVYVLGRDQLTRLHDLNGDGEADFYENFNNDITITSHYHEFALNLETDSKGDFYFTKGGNLGHARTPHHGTLCRITRDGSRLEVVATGLRAPNGLGIGPNDEITTSDNEGNWVPSSRVDWCKPGGFYGHVFTAHRPVAPTSYDPPLFWLPHTYELDNSSGGQVWVTSSRWGPLQGHMLHTSYGACSLFAVLHEEVDGVRQAGTVKFPLKFQSGIMRGRFNAGDGQLYLVGLVVWQSNGPRQGAFQRVRYTGKPVHLPTQLHVRAAGIEITFTEPLEPAAATDLENYSLEQWNYKWTQNYGSPEFSVADPEKKGRDKIVVQSARLSADRKTVFLQIPDLKPVMQMRIQYRLKAADGTPLVSEIHNTINRVPQTGS